MILCLRSDSPDTELYLLDGTSIMQQHTWRADRQLAKELLREIDALLKKTSLELKDVSGLVVYKGPGSFTGLRIGCTVLNTLAYAQQIPIVGTNDDNWITEGADLLEAGTNHGMVMPEYGAEPRITTPRK